MLEQQCQLVLAADQRQLRRLAELGRRGVQGGDRRPDRHRLVAALEREQAGAAVGDGAAGEPLGGVGDQDRAGRGRLLDAGARGDQVAGDPAGTRRLRGLGRGDRPPARGAGADQRLAGGYRDAQAHLWHAPSGAARARTGPRPLAQQRVADGQGRPHRPLGVVLAGPRHPEHGDRGAADHLLDRAAVALDLGAGPLEVAGQHAADVLGVTLAELGDGLVDVREEHGDDLALGAVRRLPGSLRHRTCREGSRGMARQEGEAASEPPTTRRRTR